MEGRFENPELRAFLESLTERQVLSGTVAAIERFGVFVALDEGPGHPAFPGVGFITIPELSWRSLDSVAEVVEVGQRVSCVFLQFDTWNMEARLSLRGMRPDPFQAFADRNPVGRVLRGRVTRLVSFGVFVEVADGIEGLVRPWDLPGSSVDAASDAVRVGDELTVVVAGTDRQRRTLTLTCGHPSSVTDGWLTD
ncbi:S1 RNA-binding domain-containing protein [Streptomyces sp. NPDC059454]|uniref:S1 RNA-binding domain-containing protein n=1 Tax=Streptomyces sp. NPDC059454 TaxID=3346836 RepID=UPI0036939DA8